MPVASKRNAMPNAASLEAEPMNAVTAVGEPSYTSGIHMWNGATPSLNATPNTMNTRPNTNRCCTAVRHSRVQLHRSSVPVPPYTIDMPYSRKPEAAHPARST